MVADEETVELVGSDGLHSVKPSIVQFAHKELSQFLSQLRSSVLSYFKFNEWNQTCWESLAHRGYHWYQKKPLDWIIRLYTYLSSKNISIVSNYGTKPLKPKMLLLENKRYDLKGFFLSKEREAMRPHICTDMVNIIPMEISALLEQDPRLKRWMQDNFDLEELTELSYCHLLAKTMEQHPSIPKQKKIELSRYVFDVYFKFYSEKKYINHSWQDPFQKRQNLNFPWYSNNGNVIPHDKIVKPYIYSEYLQSLYGLNGPKDIFPIEKYQSNVQNMVQAYVLPCEYFSSKEVCDFVFKELVGTEGLPPPIIFLGSKEVHPTFPWLCEPQQYTKEYLAKVNVLLSWMSHFKDYAYSMFYELSWFPTADNRIVKPIDTFILDSCKSNFQSTKC